MIDAQAFRLILVLAVVLAVVLVLKGRVPRGW